jgi:quercetin dioxygenase-like cupin family protein
MKYIHTPEDCDSVFWGNETDGYSEQIAGPQEMYRNSKTLKGEPLDLFHTQRLIIGIHRWCPGKAHGSHHHDNMEQSYYVFAGQAEITVGDGKKIVGPGSSAYMPLNTEHDIVAVGDETMVAAVIGCVLDEGELEAWEAVTGKYLRESKRATKYIHTPADYDGIFAGNERDGYSELVAGPYEMYQKLGYKTLSGKPVEQFPTQRLAYGLHRWHPGKSHGGHHHANMEQCYYVFAGQAEITVGDEKKIAGPGSSSYSPLNMEHNIIAVGDETLVVGVIGCVLNEDELGQKRV